MSGYTLENFTSRKASAYNKLPHDRYVYALSYSPDGGKTSGVFFIGTSKKSNGFEYLAQFVKTAQNLEKTGKDLSPAYKFALEQLNAGGTLDVRCLAIGAQGAALLGFASQIAALIGQYAAAGHPIKMTPDDMTAEGVASRLQKSLNFGENMRKFHARRRQRIA